MTAQRCCPHVGSLRGNDISGVQPMPSQGRGQATAKVEGSRGSHLARAIPMVVGIGALRCGRLLVAWLGRMAALFPTRSLFGATPVSHITPRYAPYRISEIAVGCSSSPAKVAAARG